MPKVRVKSLLYGESKKSDTTYDLEMVKKHFDEGDAVVVVEGRLISSYDDLVNLLAQDQYKDKEPVEIMLVPIIEGG